MIYNNIDTGLGTIWTVNAKSIVNFNIVSWLWSSFEPDSVSELKR